MLTSTDGKALVARLASVSTAKGVPFTKEQIKVWVNFIERDIGKKEIDPEGVFKALEKLSKIETYGRMDYQDFYDLAVISKQESDFKKKYVRDGYYTILERGEDGKEVPKKIRYGSKENDI